MDINIANTLHPLRKSSNQDGLDVRRRFRNTPCRVEVEFSEGLSTVQTVDEITKLSNPQVILWYIGCRGLRKNGVQFYKNFLISPILESKVATFWLVDLTAWGAFSSRQCSINAVSSCAHVIEQIFDDWVKIIKSAGIFKSIQGIRDLETLNYFNLALKRDFISKPSESFPNKNILIKEILPENCSIMSDWYDSDVSKAYSVFQYLEGCLIVEEVFIQQVNKDVKEIQIVFALPNDEIKYYKDGKNSFQKDVSFIISKRCRALNLKNIRLKIKFLAFRYGSQVDERPYNAPGKVIKSNALFCKDILGRNPNNNNDLSENFSAALNL